MSAVRVTVNEVEFKDIFDNRQRYVAVESDALRAGMTLEIGHAKKPGCFRVVTHLSERQPGIDAFRLASIRPLNTVEKDQLRKSLANQPAEGG